MQVISQCNHEPGMVFSTTGKDSFTNALPDYVPLEQQIPGWKTARIFFEKYIPERFVFVYARNAPDTVMIDNTWIGSILTFCPPEDKKLLIQVINKAFDAVQGYFQGQAYFWKEIYKHFDDTLQPADELALDRLNVLLQEFDRDIKRAREPSTIDIFKHVAGIKFCGPIRNIMIRVTINENARI